MEASARYRATRLACSCTLLLILSAPNVVLPVLYGAMAASLGTPQAQVTAWMPASSALTSLVMAIPGSLVMERFGVQRSIILGVLAQCLIISAQVFVACFWQLVALQAALGACGCLCNMVAFIAFCNAWFGDQPATAIAINSSAFGLAGTLWTPLAAFVSTHFGWRAAIAMVAASQWCISLPLAVFGMREPPESWPARRPTPMARGTHFLDNDEGVTWWIADAGVWLLALLNFCVLYVVYSVNQSVTLFFTDEVGISLQHASLLTSLLFFCNTSGKLVSGPLYDSGHAGAFAAGALALLAVGSAMLWRLTWQPSAGPAAVCFAVTFGLAYGFCYSLILSKAAVHFGHRRGFKALSGFLACWQAAGQISGELVTPELARTASYTTSFSLVFCWAVVALAVLVSFELREATLARGDKLTDFGAGLLSGKQQAAVHIATE